MLSVSPIKSSTTNCESEEVKVKEGEIDNRSCLLEDFSIDENFLDYIDFGSESFPGFDGEILPDLEVDPTDLLAEFCNIQYDQNQSKSKEETTMNGEKEKEKSLNKIEEATVKDDESTVTDTKSSSTSGEEQSKRSKSSKASDGKILQAKRKFKVDWTPELHRRFVQAVDQLGLDKAVPSRILELMGTDCLTRHNVASHLQKYRSHKKHILSREAEAASWSQRRQLYTNGTTCKTPDPWFPPATIGFPPPPPPPHPVPAPPFQPLRVWGHPPGVDPSLVHAWPRQMAQSYWPPHPYQVAAKQGWAPHPVMTQGAPYFPQPLPNVRIPIAPVPTVPPHPMYRPVPPLPPKQIDSHPSKESIDAAIGDVLAKPWSPLPLGLKPPSTDSVMVELQRQGVSKVPPTIN
ncbi:hypothetical protein LUZ60_009970 [Juncus effusus]|nr:hypothetical protein LUZ60_009970 [Juncus effusus]